MLNTSQPGSHRRNSWPRGLNEESCLSEKHCGCFSFQLSLSHQRASLYLLKTAQILYFFSNQTVVWLGNISPLKTLYRKQKGPWVGGSYLYTHFLPINKTLGSRKKFTPYLWIVRPESVLSMSDSVWLQTLQMPLSNTFINLCGIFLMDGISRVTKIDTGHKVWV